MSTVSTSIAVGGRSATLPAAHKQDLRVSLGDRALLHCGGRSMWVTIVGERRWRAGHETVDGTVGQALAGSTIGDEVFLHGRVYEVVEISGRAVA